MQTSWRTWCVLHLARRVCALLILSSQLAPGPLGLLGAKLRPETQKRADAVVAAALERWKSDSKAPACKTAEQMKAD